MLNYLLYWIRSNEHIDINTEGYVGVTSRKVKSRFKEHSISTFTVGNAIRKHGKSIRVDIIAHGLSECEALLLEQQYRPNKEIGWNICSGGGIPPNQKGVKKPNQSVRMRGVNNIAKRPEVQAKISKALKGRPKLYLRGTKRPEHSAMLKNLKGVNYPKFRGFYITPWGIHASYIDALNSSPYTHIPPSSLINYCIKNNKKVISKQALSASKMLYEINMVSPVLGKTFADLGFGFKTHEK